MHNHFRIWSAICGILIIPFANARADSVLDSIDSAELFQSIIKEWGSNPTYNLDRADDLWMSANCQEQEVAFCLYAKFEPSRVPVLVKQLPTCSNVFPLFHALLGSSHFHSGNFQEALNAFTAAEQEGYQPVGQAYSNLGATYFATQQWEFAITCLEDAWEATDKSNLSEGYMTLNNLSAIHLAHNEPELALAWIEEAKSNLEKMRASSESKPPLETLHSQAMTIAVNEFWAHCMLQDTAFVRENWRNIDWGSPGIQAPIWLYLITEYSQLINDEGFYSFQSRVVQHLHIELANTQGALVGSSGLSDLLREYQDLWPDDLSGMVTLWKELDELKNQFNSSSIEPPTIQRTSYFRRNVIVIANVLIGLILLFMIFQNIKSRRANGDFLNEQLLVLKDWPKTSSQAKRHSALLDTLTAFIPSNVLEYGFPAGTELNELEWTVFHSAAMREPPKELAMRENLSPSYIYAIRSSIRKKLEILEAESLESWIEMNKNSN